MAAAAFRILVEGDSSRRSTVLVFRIDLLDRPEDGLFQLLDQRIWRVFPNFLNFLSRSNSGFTDRRSGNSSERPGDFRLNRNIDAGRIQHLQQGRYDRRFIMRIAQIA